MNQAEKIQNTKLIQHKLDFSRVLYAVGMT